MDFTYLNSISDGDKEFTAQFVSTFERNSFNIIDQMETAFQEKEFEKLGKLAHQLKPSLEMFKLNSYETCLFIQNNADQAREEQLKEIKTSCEETLAALKKEFNL